MAAEAKEEAVSVRAIVAAVAVGLKETTMVEAAVAEVTEAVASAALMVE